MSRKSFSTRRGRPRTRRTAPDEGTPELREKRAAGLTSEAIDLCLRRGLITESEHRCALHFRWLYTLRFGNPGVQALDLRKTHHGAHPPPEDSPWRDARNREYRQAARLLEAEQALMAVLRVAVFDDVSPALARTSAAQETLGRLRHGLTALRRHWQGNSGRYEERRGATEHGSSIRERLHGGIEQ